MSTDTMLTRLQAAQTRAVERHQRAQRELADAEDAWEEADCPDDGEVAYLYERAAGWEKLAGERARAAIARSTEAETAAQIADGGGDL